MNYELKEEVERLVGLKKTNKIDVKKMADIIRNYIDPKFSVCTHCVAQIKFAQNQLKKWLNNGVNFTSNEETPNEEVNTPPIKEKKPGCQKCQKKTRVKK